MSHPYQNSLWGVQTREIGFDIRTPASHSTDPATSHKAEADMRSSGDMETHNKAIAWLVARYPGCTASEYFELSQRMENINRFYAWDLQEVRRRLTTIKDIHAVQGKARMGLRKKPEVTWYPK